MAKAAAKKKWFQILAPKLFNERFIGDTPSLDSKDLIDKVLNINLSILTDDMRKQNIEIGLVINKVDGDKARTGFIGLKVAPTSIKRFVRKGKSRLDQTISAITKDGKNITIKMLLVPRNVVQGSVKTGLQKETKRYLVKKIAATDYNQIAEQIVFAKLGRELKDKLGKIYPLRICDVRQFKLERLLKATEIRRIKAEVAEQLKKPEELQEDVAKEDTEKSKEEKKETVKKEEPVKKKEPDTKEVKEEK